MKRAFVALLVLLVVPFAGCGRITTPSQPSIVVTEAHNGAGVTVPLHGRLTVRLSAIPSAGYQWQVATAPAETVVRATGSGYDSPVTDRLGAAGTAWWTFEATGAGSTPLTLRYVRPWEPENAARKFTVLVIVP